MIVPGTIIPNRTYLAILTLINGLRRSNWPVISMPRMEYSSSASMHYFFIEVSLFFLIAALTFRLGDATERASALVLIGQMSISIFIALGFGTGRLPARNWVSSMTDAVVVVFLLLVVARSQKAWPPVAAGFQLAAFVQDLRISMRLSPYDFAHVTYTVVWGWCVLLSLFLGILIQKGRRFAWLPAINATRRQRLGPKDITP